MTDEAPALRAGTRDDWPAAHRLLFGAFHHAADDELTRIEGGVVEPCCGR
ncbi:hypothetical protein [Spirilliplanes yamanashiensis]|uniref:Uncharacterized protein n=1 Tax=Spirilliplanes yamanashiensis TaxID=42233 RepID=A0A8J3YDY6_9ACTN|nr:hypothetical protein [Spirilliplanes yamanashiensis]MDP9816421.1 hypothetical protein [Spirilliplanes yamanashiensis]GIJ05948.1 hypothetical protein Sya03_53000 [Spirilliplanes yamanashiensis]